MKLNNISILIFLFLFFVSTNVSYAQDICFSSDDSKRLVVELEKGRLLEQNIILLEKVNSELMKQNELLKNQVILEDEKFKSAEALVNKNKELYNQKLKVLDDELNEAKKPRWKSMFISSGVGALLTLLLVVVL
jgi:hypothetical protein